MLSALSCILHGIANSTGSFMVFECTVCGEKPPLHHQPRAGRLGCN